MATIKDVAAKAGVSIGTVSNVLNGRPQVSDEMIQRVRSAMTELGYSPNGIARSLRGQRTRTVGLIVPDNANPFFAETSWAIERACTAAGFALILCNTGRSPEREETVVELLVEKRVDGMIVATSSNLPALDHAIAAEIPMVAIDYEMPGLQADAVVVDHRRGGELSARHLVGLGHRRFGCIVGLPARANATRITAFREVLAQSGLDLADDLIRESDTHADGGYRAATELLERDPEITAIFAANDLVALGAIRACYDLGRPVPSAVSVVGYDDISIARQVLPRLTTVRQPLDEIGRRAIDVLQSRIDNRTGPAERWVLPVEFVERESTAPPPGG